MAQVGAEVPQVWNVPNRNADFTGRGPILDRLRDELAGDGAAVVLARAVYGLGGVGKTQVALEYAHRFKTDYQLIWWINAEQPLEITLALAELAGRLGLQISDNAADAAAVGPGATAPRRHRPVAAHLRQCRGPRGAGSFPADRVRAHPDHVT